MAFEKEGIAIENSRFQDLRDKLPRHPTRKWRTRKLPKIKTIVVHSTSSSNQDPFKTARYHITPGPQNHISKKGCPGVTYHDLITEDGTIYHCNNYLDIIWHAGWINTTSIGVGMMHGDVDRIPPTPIQFDTLMKYLVVCCLMFNIAPKNVIGHREVAGMYILLGNGSRKYQKTCPGLTVDMDKLRLDLTFRLQRKLASSGHYTSEVDGVWGKLSKDAMKRYHEERLARSGLCSEK